MYSFGLKSFHLNFDVEMWWRSRQSSMKLFMSKTIIYLTMILCLFFYPDSQPKNTLLLKSILTI